MPCTLEMQSSPLQRSVVSGSFGAITLDKIRDCTIHYVPSGPLNAVVLIQELQLLGTGLRQIQPVRSLDITMTLPFAPVETIEGDPVPRMLHTLIAGHLRRLESFDFNLGLTWD